MALNKIPREVPLSALVRNTYLINQDDADALFTIVNGWDASVTNIPSDAKNKLNMLFTLWTWTEDLGKPNKGTMFQQLITQNGKVYCRIFLEASGWGPWATSI